MMTRAFLTALLLSLPFAAAAQDAPPPEEAVPADKAKPGAIETKEAPVQYSVVVLQGLNKVTGHASRIDGAAGTSMRFGTLDIVVRRCWKSAPEERPENAALIEISELKTGEPPQKIFLGWMFSSSPAYSGLEHPVYDITVLDCQVKAEAEPMDASKKPE